MYQFGWFSTARDKAARDLLEVAHNSIRQGGIKAGISFVFCNREPGESAQSDLFLKMVEGYGIPLVCFSYQKYKIGRASSQQGEALPQWRFDYDLEVMKRLKAFNPDLCILAGYMLIVGREMCSRYDMINLHPAAPGGPAGTWQEVIWQLIETKVKETGVMMHLVTPELDKGPIVSYCTFSIADAPFDSYWREIEGQDINEIKRQQGENNPLFRLIRKHGLKREFPLILATMKAFSEGKVKINQDKKVVDADGKPIMGYNLTEEINKLIKKEYCLMNFICFDLEGPLTPQDNAYDLMKLFPDGDRVFEVISRYDDLLTMEGREGYEPGDTLALIVPFLLLHNISEGDIAALATKATLTGGAAELVSLLKSSGWEVFCITTTYEQYAKNITQILSIPASNVASTSFPLDKFNELLCQEDTTLLHQIEKDIINIGDDDRMIKQKLDDFFWMKLPRTQFGRAISNVKPIGGRRKVDAINSFCQRFSQPLSNWVIVGDSITDFRILKAADNAGGLAVAFNANQYALPYATMSLASIDISDLSPVLKAWQEGSRNEVQRVVRAKEKSSGDDSRDNFHWLSDKKEINDIIILHKRMRNIVREEAGKLG